MRRIVVIASGMSGIRCATRIKRRMPQSEVNVIIPAALEEFARNCRAESGKAPLGPVSRRLAIDMPDLETLRSREVAVIEAADIMTDPAEREVTVTSTRGTVGIRYTELVLEVAASVRLPRSMQNAENVFGWPMATFSAAPALCEKALAKAAADKQPVVVVGNGPAALEAACLALESGAPVHWLRTGERDVPAIEPQIMGAALRYLGENLTVTGLASLAPDQLRRVMSDDGSLLTGIILPDGTTAPCSCCFWTSPVMAVHPILREEGVTLDALGRIELDEEKNSAKGLYVVGSGAAVPPARLPGSKQTAPVYGGCSENAELSARSVMAAITGDVSLCPPDTGSLGIAEAVTSRLACLKAGFSYAEAASAGLEAEYAITEISEKGENQKDARCILSLVCHKNSRTLLGAQVLGTGSAKAVAEGLFAAVLAALADGTHISSLSIRTGTGIAGRLLGRAADILRNKLDTVIKGITPDELIASRDAGANFFTLDVRSLPDWEQGHVAGSHNIPLPQLKKRLQAEVPHFTPLVVISEDGADAYSVACMLQTLGATDLYVLDGGMRLWPYKIEKGE